MQKMKNFLIVFIILVSIANSCIGNMEPQIMKFDDIIRDVKDNSRAAWIMIGDYSIIEDAESSGFRKLMSRYSEFYDFYFCDISLQENEHVNYIYYLEALPAAMLVSPDGVVEYISDCVLNYGMLKSLSEISDNYTRGIKPEFSNSNFRVKDSQLIEIYANTYNIYVLDKTNNVDAISNYINSTEQAVDTEPYFYNLYLLSKCYAHIGNQVKSKEYRERAIKWFEEDGATLYTYLCMDLIKDMDENMLADIDIECTDIDLGKIPSETITEKIVRYKNVGNSPLVIINASISCPCVELKWDDALKPGEIGEIKLKYKADDIKGPFYKTALLIMNTSEGSKMLSIRGTVL